MKNSLNSIPADDFKARRLQLMDEVNEKHISIITKHGQPVAKLTPIEETPMDLFGCLKNALTIKKDIMVPVY